MEENDSPGFDQDRAYILATCTALGGFEDRQVGPNEFVKVYSLGDEALGCLRDLKAAIRAQAQSPVKTFLAAMYEYNLLENDLVPIIRLYKDDHSEVGLRFVLACVELLVPMTWPLQKPKHMEDEEYDPNQVDRYRKFKKALLEPDVLETIMYLLVGPLSTPYRERSNYDHTIIRLVLYLFRNLAAIPDLNASQAVTGLSADLTNLQERMVIRFAEVGILDLLLVIGSNSMEAGVAEWNVIILEILYNILRHVRPRDVFALNEEQSEGNKGGILTEKLNHLMNKEKMQVRIHNRTLPSRHSRFGGTYAVNRNDGRAYVFHKQTAGYRSLGTLIDSQKKPDMRGRKRKEMDEVNVHVTYRKREALRTLKEMAKNLLANSFNSLYRSIRRDIEREDPKITEADYIRFFYTMQWFLGYLVYEKAAQDKRKQKEKEKEKESAIFGETLLLPSRTSEAAAQATEKEAITNEEEKQDELLFDYDLAATALDLTSCLLCLRRLRTAIDKKMWLDAQVAADCLRQMLTIIGNMAMSDNQEHRDVAEYIQSNIFHESTNLDVFVDLIRQYKHQSYGYLTSAVQLIHVVLRTLEQYAKKKQVVFVRKGRKGLASRRPEAEGEDVPDSDPEEDEDEEEEERTPSERIFRFESFEKKFATYDVIQVYCTLLERYQELDQAPLHAIVSLFHRIMVKRQIEHVFWKLPTLNLFSQILTEAKYAQSSPGLKQLVEFINYCTRQFFKRAKEYPLLYIEVLFVNAKVGRISED